MVRLSGILNKTLNQTIGGCSVRSFIRLRGFGVPVESNNTTYYVLDQEFNMVYMFNDRWNCVDSKFLFSPFYMITTGATLFITTDSVIYKTDSHLNVLDQYKTTDRIPGFRGIYFNSTKSLIYVAGFNSQTIHVFNLNLTLNHIIEILNNNNVMSISEYRDVLYVGIFNKAEIFVIVNKSIINIINSNCYSEVLQAIVDKCGYLAVLCMNFYIELFFVNGTYANKKMIIPYSEVPTYFGFDSIGRFVILSETEIRLYN